MTKYIYLIILLTACIFACVKYANISCQTIFSPSFSVVGGAGRDFIEFGGTFKSFNKLIHTEKTQYLKQIFPEKGLR